MRLCASSRLEGHHAILRQDTSISLLRSRAFRCVDASLPKLGFGRRRVNVVCPNCVGSGACACGSAHVGYGQPACSAYTCPCSSPGARTTVTLGS
eukprot:6205764-Pleurochrysis_carterae.AAC.1